MPYSRMLFEMTLSDLQWQIFNDTKHRAASLRESGAPYPIMRLIWR